MATTSRCTLNISGTIVEAFMTDENIERATQALDKVNNPEEKSHIYFVSYIETVDGNVRYGNCAVGTTSTGVQLAKDCMRFVLSTNPNAVVLSISKLD